MTNLMGFQPDDAFSFKQDASGCNREKLIDTVECRGLSAAVGTDKTENLSFFHLKGDPVNGQ
jgi:hypothetical protein